MSKIFFFFQGANDQTVVINILPDEVVTALREEGYTVKEHDNVGYYVMGVVDNFNLSLPTLKPILEKYNIAIWAHIYSPPG